MSIKSFCRGLAVFFLVFGILGSFFLAYAGGEVVEVSRWSSYESVVRDWPMTLAIFTAGVSSVLLVVTVLFGFAQLLDNTEATAAYLKQIGEDQAEIIKEIKQISLPTNSEGKNGIPEGYWKCSQCGKLNASYVGTCSCGKNKE